MTVRRRCHGATVLRAAVLACCVIAFAAEARAGVWRGSWGAAPAAAMGSAVDLPAEWSSPVIEDRTVSQTVRLSAGGMRLRLRFSNEFGTRPVALGHVRVALEDAFGRAEPVGGREVTFSGSTSAVMAPHAPLVSDPVDLSTPALARLRISIFLPGDAAPCTCHADGRATTAISMPGDHVEGDLLAVAHSAARVFLAGVEVEGEPAHGVVVALGDSITDGYMSTIDANRRWPDRLAERLAASGTDMAVVNAGIGGNRLLGEDVLPAYGQAAPARFDRDVLAVPGVTHVIVLEGINDIGASPSPDPRLLIAAYRQLIARAHAHGVKVLLGVVPPYEGAPYYRQEGESVRQAVNAWIRSQTEADGIVDFDAALRDPTHPARLKAQLQSGDWLHPNDAGYRAMGDAVDLGLLR